jgi:hypothetical protein
MFIMISEPKEWKSSQDDTKGSRDMELRTRPGFTPLRIGQSTFRRNRFQRGQATLEILIVLLILIPLIFGGIELSRGVAIRSALDSGVGIAARTLSIDPSQWGWSANLVATTVTNNILGCTAPCTVHLEAYTPDGTLINEGINSLSYGSPFYLVGWVVFSPEIPLLNPGPITIKVQHFGVIERIEP